LVSSPDQVDQQQQELQRLNRELQEQRAESAHLRSSLDNKVMVRPQQQQDFYRLLLLYTVNTHFPFLGWYLLTCLLGHILKRKYKNKYFKYIYFFYNFSIIIFIYFVLLLLYKIIF